MYQLYHIILRLSSPLLMKYRWLFYKLWENFGHFQHFGGLFYPQKAKRWKSPTPRLHLWVLSLPEHCPSESQCDANRAAAPSCGKLCIRAKKKRVSKETRARDSDFFDKIILYNNRACKTTKSVYHLAEIAYHEKISRVARFFAILLKTWAPLHRKTPVYKFVSLCYN